MNMNVYIYNYLSSISFFPINDDDLILMFLPNFTQFIFMSDEINLISAELKFEFLYTLTEAAYAGVSARYR
ncbi:hypothetical protein BpHYR1_009816 [Brachionus plicatilis]|uniref:Uncharacterized protein n=1 Tax=Brachionus plicatilis TaxID=10195 RepID=A0A3M7RX69_BRAPC|nr:hypothetical protein BpHYR1_009816 [Brachionus plicatilis]